MAAYIHHIATRTPSHAYRQTHARDLFKSWTDDDKTKRLIHAIYNRSGIETRYSVCDDFMAEGAGGLFRSRVDGQLQTPGTLDRNLCYARESRKLAVDLVRQALSEADGFSASDVTHLIFTSCTGFTNPGPDYHIIRELGLSENVQRYTLGFMGCYAAFPALRMAAQFCEADPDAVVLVVCLELCTLHMQINNKPDNILANSLFADGAAAAIVSACLPGPDQPAYKLCQFQSALLPAAESAMTWDIGNEGFNITLSSYVPEVIGTNIGSLVSSMLQQHGLDLPDISEWAVHPGGRSILDNVETNLGLAPGALLSSRSILRDYGNMSSATILFVLKHLQDETRKESDCVIDGALTFAMAFGPGLTVETALLEQVSSCSRQRHDQESESSPLSVSVC